MEAKCRKNHRTFYPRYDLAADDCWVLTYGIKDLPQGQSVGSAGGAGMDLGRTRTGPQYRCPWCGNKDYVRCGRCGNLTCYRDGDFECAYCGNVGKVTGTISADQMKKLVKTTGSGQ